MSRALPELIPKDMENKMNFFLRAIAPIKLTNIEYEHYEFTKEDIIALCRSALFIMFKQEDEYFNELTTNFAKYIYQLLGINWSDQMKIPLRMLQECFKKANQYDHQLLSLLYGSVGLISLESRSDGLEGILSENIKIPELSK